MPEKNILKFIYKKYKKKKGGQKYTGHWKLKHYTKLRGNAYRMIFALNDNNKKG